MIRIGIAYPGRVEAIYSYWAFIGNKAFYKGPNKCYTSPMPGSQMTGWHLAGVNLSFLMFS